MSLTANDLIADACNRIRQIPAAQLSTLESPYRLIDVREPAEFAQGHLPGAINIPRGLLEFKIDAHPALLAEGASQADRQQALVLYCLSGGRSALAADSLQHMGFKNVQSLLGGIKAWTDAGLAITQNA